MTTMNAIRSSQNFREYTTADRSKWPDAEWCEGEPDKVQWIDAETGLDCLMVRNPSGGNWCGYVGVDESHPFHGKDYNDVDVEVHGGLTFADKCAETADESRFICHVPAPGRPDHVWWFGFDCAHSFDLSPGYKRDWARGHGESYRDVNYVVREVQSLARQLASLKGGR